MPKSCSQNNQISWKSIKKRLNSFIKDITTFYQIDKIILFGSFARGDYHENSDIDLIIVGNFKEKFFDRIGKILEYIPDDLEIELLVYTIEEFKNMKKNENPFLLNCLSEGINLI